MVGFAQPATVHEHALTSRKAVIARLSNNPDKVDTGDQSRLANDARLARECDAVFVIKARELDIDRDISRHQDAVIQLLRKHDVRRSMSIGLVLDYFDSTPHTASLEPQAGIWLSSWLSCSWRSSPGISL